MRIKISAELKELNRSAARVSVSCEQEHVIEPLLNVCFLAMLRNMKDTNEREFYVAMAAFAEEDYEHAMKYLGGEEDD